MRYPRGHKQKTHRRILEAAGRVFRRRGFHASGIDGVMEEANLTAGAFYRHFENKDALLEQLVETAFDEGRALRERGLEGLDGLAWVEGMVHNYLSPTHLDRVEEGCPLPTLLSEIARAGESTRSAFEREMSRWRDQIASHFNHLPVEERRSLAAGVIATLVGGMTVARALPTRAEAEASLAAAAERAVAGLEGRGGHTQEERPMRGDR